MIGRSLSATAGNGSRADRPTELRPIVAHACAPVCLCAATANASKCGQKHPDDIVIVSALRTMMGRARKGGLKDTPVEEMLAGVLKATLERTKVPAAAIGDIVVGTVLGGGSQRANECRIASFLAGIPETVPIHTVNRQCSSGLQALAHVAANINAGYYGQFQPLNYARIFACSEQHADLSSLLLFFSLFACLSDIGIAAGVESMSLSAFAWEGTMNPKVFINKQAKDCLLPMGITSENVAARYGVSRKDQDEFAVSSHRKAAAAIKAGKFKAEIVPLNVTLKDPKTGATKDFVADTDDGVREDTTFESLSKLNPVFQKGGSTTAGNASQVTDGAAAVLACKRSTAEKMGLPIQGVFRTFAVTGVAPDVMGIGPAAAIPPALKAAGLSVSDIDVWEINEAFASQAVYCVRKLGIPVEKVNPNGGAIALGHPLGCTGARQVATLLNELKRRGAKYGVTSMCIGSVRNTQTASSAHHRRSGPARGDSAVPMLTVALLSHSRSLCAGHGSGRRVRGGELNGVQRQTTRAPCRSRRVKELYFFRRQGRSCARFDSRWIRFCCCV